MNNFRYTRVKSVPDALAALEGIQDGRFMAGGTDLIPLMKDEIMAPGGVIDIGGWEDGRRIEALEDGLRIGALASLSEIARHEEVGRSYAALAEACRVAATPQLRKMGTIGGNLLQQTRCWYYRGPYDCWLKGGSTCFARGGENEYHAIFMTEPEISPCVSAHPSDPAAALLALNGRVRFRVAGGEGEMTVEQLYALPEEGRRSFTVLPDDAILTEVVLPLKPAGGRSGYVKAMARAAWGFALAGIAVSVHIDGPLIKEARVVLGGVAPIPMRATRVEELMTGSELSKLDVLQLALAEALVADASPLAHNGYKVDLLNGLLKESLARLEPQPNSRART